MSAAIRALCAELIEKIDYTWGDIPSDVLDLINRARAELAQLEPKMPTEREVSEWINSLPLWHGANRDELPAIVLRAFSRWGRPAVPPVAQPDSRARLRHCDIHGQQPENAWGCPECVRELRQRLAQPGPQGLTDEAIEADFRSWWKDRYGSAYFGAIPLAACIEWTRGVLARYGRPAVAPVAVSERPWEREGWCDAEGRSWWGRPSEELCNSDWFLATRAEVEEFCEDCLPVVSLPYWALPLPTTSVAPVARPIDEWHEDMGAVLWWRFPVEEPPWCGSPLDTEWVPGYYTHFTQIVVPQPCPHIRTNDEGTSYCELAERTAADHSAPEEHDQEGATAPVAQNAPDGLTDEQMWYPAFTDWLERELPEGTVIGDPLWWASKIANYLALHGRPAVAPVAVEALQRLRRWGGMVGSMGYSPAVIRTVDSWIDGGMVGPLPPLPDHIAALPITPQEPQP